MISLRSMGSNPVNLAVRFILEVTTMIIVGMWGWKLDASWLKFIYAIGFPSILVGLWVTFNVPNDPSRSGKAPIVVPGWIRLLLELAFFTLGTYAFYQLGYSTVCWVNGVVVIVHYLISYDRVAWLLKR